MSPHRGSPPPLLHPRSAGGFPWEANRAVRNCVRERRCWEKGTTAVCGRVPGSRHRTYGFPNRCCEYSATVAVCWSAWAAHHVPCLAAARKREREVGTARH